MNEKRDIQDDLSCWQCGGDLSALSLPISRRDLCRHCASELHVCRMCRHYDRDVARQCREDDAEDVTEKERLNFCDWFEPSEDAFDPVAKAEADRSQRALDALTVHDRAALLRVALVHVAVVVP